MGSKTQLFIFKDEKLQITPQNVRNFITDTNQFRNLSNLMIFSRDSNLKRLKLDSEDAFFSFFLSEVVYYFDKNLIITHNSNSKTTKPPKNKIISDNKPSVHSCTLIWSFNKQNIQKDTHINGLNDHRCETRYQFNYDCVWIFTCTRTDIYEQIKKNLAILLV